jgi:hypothetical protein
MPKSFILKSASLGLFWANTLFAPAIRIALIAMNAADKGNVLFKIT